MALRSKEEAWEIAKIGRRLADGMPGGEGYFGCIAGVLGHTVEARRVVEELQARREKGCAPASPIARTYLNLGEIGHAMSRLATALAERDPFLGSLMVFPGYGAMRDQPRFKQLAQQLEFST